MTDKAFKQPISVLVVVHSEDGQFLLLERAAHPGFWQSVTGSREAEETPEQTAWRELNEETGLGPSDGTLTDHQTQTVYEIWPQWRHRYAPDVTHNTEHLFSFCLPHPRTVALAQTEHQQQQWLSAQAGAQTCFSPSNRDGIIRVAGQLKNI